MRYITVILAFFLFLGCSEQSKKEVKEVSEKVQNVDVQKVVQKTQEKAQETTQDVIKAVKEVDVQKIVEETKTKATQIVTDSIAKGEDIGKNVQKEAVKMLDSVQKTTAVDGAALFASKCASCHGSNAEKAALGQSQIIAGWSEQKLKDAINGYKDGSYGRNMKMLMKGQVGSLSDEQINALAAFVASK